MEASPAVLSALEAWVEDRFRMLYHENEAWLRVVTDEPRRQRALRRMAYDLYDAMLTWMGPGGDPAFLDLYLFAEARLPPFVAGHDVRMSKEVGDGWREDSVGVIRGHRHLFPGQLPMVQHPHWGAKRCEREAKRMLRAVHKMGLTGVWHAVSLRPASFPIRWPGGGRPSSVFFGILVAPSPSFRESLMAEQATPWPLPTRVPVAFLRPPRLVRRPA